MTHLLYYYFFMDSLKQIEPKYRNIITPVIDKAFLYSNFKEIPQYYNLLSLNKNHEYDIYQRLNQSKMQEALEFLKKETINNQYNETYLLFLMAFISHKVLHNYLEGFSKLTNHPSKHLKYLELYLYKKKTNNKTYKKFNAIKFFEKSLTLTEFDKNIIKNLFSKVYFFSYGLKHFEISLIKFKKIKQKYQKDFLGFKTLKLTIFSNLKNNKKIKYIIKNPKNKNDFLNDNKASWSYLNTISKNLNFDELYNEAIMEAAHFINIICEEIFYNKTIKKGLANLF